MSIAAVEALQTVAVQQMPALSTALQGSPGSPFDTMVSAGLSGVNRALLRTEADAQRLAVGEVQNLHQVMIHMEEAKASFQLLLQVRNRLMDAYQEVMRMQI